MSETKRAQRALNSSSSCFPADLPYSWGSSSSSISGHAALWFLMHSKTREPHDRELSWTTVEQQIFSVAGGTQQKIGAPVLTYVWDPPHDSKLRYYGRRCTWLIPVSAKTSTATLPHACTLRLFVRFCVVEVSATSAQCSRSRSLSNARGRCCTLTAGRILRLFFFGSGTLLGDVMIGHDVNPGHDAS